ncbi:FAD-dependent oxidoreductase [Ralstonia pseudosolanacearum]|uniref:FAD-binding oxidoreductase n=1 Tax=Ralstonia solanacearum TaxID=305 RepID=A0A0S4X3X6_RALSL|nr:MULTISPECIES: FAD-dependent oxidoreductase [Ralstonia]UZF14791.1 FAD-binding oxidoreductase [Ralstonia solanacearum]UZF29927.1 FAD-binding oxidoreductase [Ralstonia sp. RS650]CUV58535.1 putative d-amino acid oxidase flavoprotein oxidoreductase [Ralstonia solanacearum]
MPTPFDVTILGGGLAGRLCAWQLAQTGVPPARIAVVERGARDGSGSAAYVAAAMLAPLAEAAVADRFVVELGLASLTLWRDWLPMLRTPVFFQQAGTLVVWHPADRGEASLFANHVRAATPPERIAADLRAVDAEGIGTLEPALAQRFSQGLYLAGEGQLDNRAVLDALATELEALGVQLRWNTAVADPHPQALAAAGLGARLVLDCRGLGAQPQWPQLRGLRGEVARIHAPDVTLTRPVRMLHPRYPIYIAPKPGHVYVIGATEIESDDMSPVSVRSTLELLSAAYAVHPAFGEARVLELCTQCRPTLPDHRPAIRWDGAGTLSVNGLYRHGYMIAPAVAQAAVAAAHALLDGRAIDAPASAWPGLFAAPASPKPVLP